jgi:hypothetical protein
MKAVHMLVVDPKDDLDNWIDMITLCRKEGKFRLCGNILRRLGAPLSMFKLPGENEESVGIDRAFSSSDEYDRKDKDAKDLPNLEDVGYFNSPGAIARNRVLYNTFKYLYSSGERTYALTLLTHFLKTFTIDKVNTSDTAEVFFQMS